MYCIDPKYSDRLALGSSADLDQTDSRGAMSDHRGAVSYHRGKP